METLQKLEIRPCNDDFDTASATCLSRDPKPTKEAELTSRVGWGVALAQVLVYLSREADSASHPDGRNPAAPRKLREFRHAAVNEYLGQKAFTSFRWNSPLPSPPRLEEFSSWFVEVFEPRSAYHPCPILPPSRPPGTSLRRLELHRNYLRGRQPSYPECNGDGHAAGTKVRVDADAPGPAFELRVSRCRRGLRTYHVAPGVNELEGAQDGLVYVREWESSHDPN